MPVTRHDLAHLLALVGAITGVACAAAPLPANCAREAINAWRVHYATVKPEGRSQRLLDALGAASAALHTLLGQSREEWQAMVTALEVAAGDAPGIVLPETWAEAGSWISTGLRRGR